MTVDYTFIQTLNFDFIEFLKFESRPCRAKFIPAKVWTDLDKYRGMGEHLSNYFKKWKTKVVYRRDRKATEFALVGGEYDFDDDYMELQIYTSSPYCVYEWNDVTWDRFKYKIIQTMMHEFVHYMQFTNRNDPYRNYTVNWRRSGKQKIDVDREYYSSIDEIQAYAHCVLLDYHIYSSEKRLADFLNQKNRNPSPTLREIFKIFKGSDVTTIRKIREHTLRWDKRYITAIT
jgi:hypothetical protein